MLHGPGWAEDGGDSWRFYVADNGIGVPSENLAKIWEKFSRGSNTEGVSGTGLGLYIVQRGAVRLVVETEEDDEPTEVGRVRESGFFGVHALFGDVRRQETAQAVTETRMLGFFRPDLNSLIKRHPKSGAAVMLAFAQYVVAHDLEALQLLIARAGRATAHQALHQALSDDKRTGVVTPLSF